jgi:hypothetical protein
MPLPVDVTARLTPEKYSSDLRKDTLKDKPCLEGWCIDNFPHTTDFRQAEQVKEFTAYSGLLCERFTSYPLEIPLKWREGRIHSVREHYRLSDVNNINNLQINTWDDKFANPERHGEGKENEWLLRRNLANDFVKMFLQSFRKWATMIPSTVERTLEKNQHLRQLTGEALTYDSVAIRDAFYERLPGFIERLGSKDDFVTFCLSQLTSKFVDSDAIPRVDFILNQINAYVDMVANPIKKPERQRLAETAKVELNQVFKTIVMQHGKLKRKLEMYQR